ncbi:TonB-dependent receptor [Arundinibacter roseus]|uniref:SusC/RagA family TonB-linked outer membrane protein n=1 Tax=Arundinibacter roseus TaxID=2070510 RepID=A0A4R4K5I1_9BACT|nr:TonB-dependent receptor [Arundinibacter roseus]TDB62744.1 SusC/RagA family TonB-linked outer membrane protein [Arundinibacter roseus]
MKKSLQKQKKLLVLMRISLVQLCIAVIFAGFSLARDASAQELLNQKISLIAVNQNIRSVLSEIEQKANVRFTYRPKLLTNQQKISINVSNEPLGDALEQILAPLQIKYRVIGKEIVLSPLASSYAAPSPFSIVPIVIPDRLISGIVTDDKGEALPGVSIVLKGTQRGTTTEANGKYSINLPDGPATLIFSFVGYTSQEIAVGNQTQLNIILEADTKSLEEVVVVGYGTQQKKDLTGAVSMVQGDAITNRKTTQISQALQGTMPGVMVTRSSNAPGATAQIRVRGITTITDAGANPLIIMDGVPIDDINSINPNDVESISVLKDAASASIYGSRAAAGVILVTTKRAKNGQLNLDYTAEYGFEKPTRLPDYVDAVRFMQLSNELRWNDNNNNTNEYPTFAKDLIDNYGQLHADNPDLNPNTDWRSLILRNSAPRSSHILGISASGKAISTRVSLGYDKTEALYDNRDYQRVTARINNDIIINKFLSAAVDLNFRRVAVRQPTVDPLYRVGITPPIYAAQWADGRLASGKDGDNIYGMLHNGGFNHAWYNQVGGKIGLDFKPIEGLKLSGVLSPFFSFDKVKDFRTRVPFTAWNDPNLQVGYLNGYNQTNLSEARNDNYRYTTQFLANYDKQIGKNSFSLLAGYEYFYAFNENLSASRNQYLLSSYPYLDIGPLEFRNNGGGASENAYRSWFGRVMYNYNSKYLFQANIRYDASSRFAPGYRWGAFPSFSAGWTVSEESFMKGAVSKWLPYLKLRASWGSLGNERIGNYPYHSILQFENNTLFYQGSNVVSAQSAAQWQYAIRNISWETTESFDVGFDAHFFRDRLKVTGDYYKKTTRDMLLELQIPMFLGFDNPNQNTGIMQTHGWEGQISWNDRKGDLSYSASFNLSDFRSRMGDLGGTEFLGDQIKIQGSEFNEWFGYVSDGLYQTQDEVDNSPKLNANVKPGDVKYKDISGPDGIPDGRISPEYDRVLLGGSLPRLMYGANFNLNYKGWSLGVVLQGVGKQNSRLGSHIVRPLQENWGNFPAILDGNSWSKYNSEEQNRTAIYPRYTNTLAGNNYAMSDFWLINGGYFRLKNISLSYNIPNNLTKPIGIQNLRLYGTATDVFSIHNFPKGWDPEMSSFAYPITTSIVFGVSVQF